MHRFVICGTVTYGAGLLSRLFSRYREEMPFYEVYINEEVARDCLEEYKKAFFLRTCLGITEVDAEGYYVREVVRP